MKSARQEILDNLRRTTLSVDKKPDFMAPLFPPLKKSLDLTFKKNLELVSGIVNIFDSENELHDYLSTFLSSYNSDDIFCYEPNIKELLNNYGCGYSSNRIFEDSVPIGITGCEYLIAHTGSIMVSSAQIGGRKIFVYPETHVVIGKKEQLVENLDDAYKGIQEKYQKQLPSQIVLITGPSRTADIEKTLTLGAHGPKELLVFLY